MTLATKNTVREADESAREDAADRDRRAWALGYVAPLPGVMDFVGAHVGGELAEERWS